MDQRELNAQNQLKIDRLLSAQPGVLKACNISPNGENPVATKRTSASDKELQSSMRKSRYKKKIKELEDILLQNTAKYKSKIESLTNTLCSLKEENSALEQKNKELSEMLDQYKNECDKLGDVAKKKEEDQELLTQQMAEKEKEYSGNMKELLVRHDTLKDENNSLEQKNKELSERLGKYKNDRDNLGGIAKSREEDQKLLKRQMTEKEKEYSGNVKKLLARHEELRANNISLRNAVKKNNAIYETKASRLNKEYEELQKANVFLRGAVKRMIEVKIAALSHGDATPKNTKRGEDPLVSCVTPVSCVNTSTKHQTNREDLNPQEVVLQLQQLASSVISISRMQDQMVHEAVKREKNARARATEEREQLMQMISKQESDMEATMKKRESLIRALHEEEEEVRIAALNKREEILVSTQKIEEEIEATAEAERKHILSAVAEQKTRIEMLDSSLASMSLLDLKT
mmetsp:Transcript_18966/g.27796  ORF Transcript_18966/g.27796 Transcript_18966/m.27796 type:complete len:461 (+) Transcript_18966:1545-2927(+)